MMPFTDILPVLHDGKKVTDKVLELLRMNFRKVMLNSPVPEEKREY